MSTQEIIERCKSIVASKDDQEHLVEELVLFIVESCWECDDVESDDHPTGRDDNIDDTDDETFEPVVKKKK